MCVLAGEIAEGEPIRIKLLDLRIVRPDDATLPCDPDPDFLVDMVQADGAHANQVAMG